VATPTNRPSALLDTRVLCCGDQSEPRPSGSGAALGFADRRASARAYIDYMRARCVEPARVLKKANKSICDYHACGLLGLLAKGCSESLP
jgi:hypothetical protein